MNEIGDLTDVSGSDCIQWELADSGNLALNFKVIYTDTYVKSIRFSKGGDLVNYVGDNTDADTDFSGYILNPDAAGA